MTCTRPEGCVCAPNDSMRYDYCDFYKAGAPMPKLPTLDELQAVIAGLVEPRIGSAREKQAQLAQARQAARAMLERLRAHGYGVPEGRHQTFRGDTPITPKDEQR